jgi:hypothetical protein
MFDKHGIPIDGGNHICAMYFGVRERDDVLGSIACDQLEIKTSTEHILSHDEFDPQEIIEFRDEDLLKTHPLVKLSGMRIENPYYLTPREFLADRSRGPAASD